MTRQIVRFVLVLAALVAISAADAIGERLIP